MAKKSRRKFSADFKAKVVLEALKERSTIEDLARKYELHPTQINTWKKEAMTKMASVFGAGNSEEASDHEQQTEKLYAQIGQLKVENDFLKKKQKRLKLKRKLKSQRTSVRTLKRSLKQQQPLLPNSGLYGL